MTDSELADAVVALGVGSVGRLSGGYFASADGMPLGGRSASHFVRDWRVAGALMEKCLHRGIETQEPVTEAMLDCLPRAIVAACVEAMI